MRKYHETPASTHSSQSLNLPFAPLSTGYFNILQSTSRFSVYAPATDRPHLRPPLQILHEGLQPSPLADSSEKSTSTIYLLLQTKILPSNSNSKSATGVHSHCTAQTLLQQTSEHQASPNHRKLAPPCKRPMQFRRKTQLRDLL